MNEYLNLRVNLYAFINTSGSYNDSLSGGYISEIHFIIEYRPTYEILGLVDPLSRKLTFFFSLETAEISNFFNFLFTFNLQNLFRSL